MYFCSEIAVSEMAVSEIDTRNTRQADEISIGVLKQRAEVMLQATHEFKNYEVLYKGLSMEEM